MVWKWFGKRFGNGSPTIKINVKMPKIRQYITYNAIYSTIHDVDIPRLSVICSQAGYKVPIYPRVNRDKYNRLYININNMYPLCYKNDGMGTGGSPSFRYHIPSLIKVRYPKTDFGKFFLELGGTPYDYRM